MELDPDSAEKPKKPKNFRFYRLTLLGFAALSLCGWTLAAAINIDAGENQEFGQGVIQAVACDQYITIEPKSVMNQSSGLYFLQSVRIADIANQLVGSRITVDVFDNSNESVLSTPITFSYSVAYGQGLVFLNSSWPSTSSYDYSTAGGGINNENGRSSIIFTDLTGPDGLEVPTAGGLTFTLQTSGIGNC
jgi:hypothetical protein